MRSPVVTHTRLLHVPEILVPRNRAAAERAIFNCSAQCLLSARLHACFHQIAHRSDLRPQPSYCSSLTFSIQSASLPSSFSRIAICVIGVVGAAPCQCFSLGGNQTTSPGRISSTGPPSR